MWRSRSESWSSPCPIASRSSNSSDSGIDLPGGSGTTSGIGSSRIFRRRYSEITLRQMPLRNAPTANGLWIFSARVATRKRAKLS